MMNQRRNILFGLAVAAVFTFSGLFAFNVHAFVVNRQDNQAARETASQTLRIFNNWQANQPPIVTTTTLPALYIQTDTTATPGALDVTVHAPGSATYIYTLMQALRIETGNDDIIAFIHIPGTHIQYVVVQGRDNAFYLERDLFGQRNSAGTVFMDYRNNADFSDPSTILYGHNMRSGLKFSQLHLFNQQDFFLENRYIQIFTDNGLIEYEIFAVFSTHISFNYIQVHFQGNEFEQLIHEIVQRCYHNANIPITADDQILLLSTCTSVYIDDRWVVAGRRI